MSVQMMSITVSQSLELDMREFKFGDIVVDQNIPRNVERVIDDRDDHLYPVRTTYGTYTKEGYQYWGDSDSRNNIHHMTSREVIDCLIGELSCNLRL